LLGISINQNSKPFAAIRTFNGPTISSDRHSLVSCNYKYKFNETNKINSWNFFVDNSYASFMDISSNKIEPQQKRIKLNMPLLSTPTNTCIILINRGVK
jgi:hypothetical protein